MKSMDSYTEELQQLHHRRIYFLLPAGAFLLLFFALLDWIITPHHFHEFLLYRVLLTAGAAGLLIINHNDRKNRYALPIGFVFYLAASFFVIFTIQQTGGITSPFYVGLFLIMTVYTALAPLTPLQTLNVCFTVVIFYCLTILYLQSLESLHVNELFSNVFFMVSFALIVATQSWVSTRLLQREYKLRFLAQNAAKKLHHHARNLQLEVLKRSKKQAETEKQHRLLFEQIADDALVITPTGKIVESNSAFQQHYMPTTGATVTSILHITPHRNRDSLMRKIKEMVSSRQPLSRYHTLLITKNLTVTEVEINGNLVKSRSGAVSILLMIRDITTRKELEQQLIASLEAKKKTETAAIMALAKLSEFRDITTDNHLERIREYCRTLALELANRSDLNGVMTPTYIEDIYHACILHDIGKVSVSDEILYSQHELSESDRDKVRKHTLIGGDVIKEMEKESEGSGFLDMAKHIAYFHHERWDGKGYPYGLTGRQIPLAARIMSVADSYEHMTADIAADGPLSHKDAASTILRGSGTRFDPMVVETFIAKQAEINQIRQKYFSE